MFDCLGCSFGLKFCGILGEPIAIMCLIRDPTRRREMGIRDRGQGRGGYWVVGMRSRKALPAPTPALRGYHRGAMEEA